jgi:hypothetical protein
MDFGIAVRVDEVATASQQPGYSGTLELSGARVCRWRRDEREGRCLRRGPGADRDACREDPGRGAIPRQQCINQILNQPVELPPEVNVDNQLAGIILKACARDPSLRTASAAQMKAAT